jgi:hypothetical protein
MNDVWNLRADDMCRRRYFNGILTFIRPEIFDGLMSEARDGEPEIEGIQMTWGITLSRFGCATVSDVNQDCIPYDM